MNPMELKKGKAPSHFLWLHPTMCYSTLCDLLSSLCLHTALSGQNTDNSWAESLQGGAWEWTQQYYLIRAYLSMTGSKGLVLTTR